MTELVFNVFGGLAIFVFGMKLMSDGLHKAAGEKMRSILRLFSANRFIAVISGAVVTCVIQSSSASTVMVIGFVNAGLLSLVQAIGIIFGANIGTTITAQLVAFDISSIIMPSIAIGLVMSFFSRKEIANWSETVLGFGFLFLGMNFMGNELKSLSEFESFRNMFQLFKCAPVDGSIPFLALLGAIGVGLVTTFIIQSSSACSGIVIALGISGLVDLYTATALIVGSNIGTTVTAQLAALTANRIAKQAALAHTLFNLIGALVVCGSFYIIIDGQPVFFKAVEMISSDGTLARQIANSHTIFNVVTTVILLPFVPLLAKICEKIIPVREEKVKYQVIDEHFLDTPSIALAQATTAVHKMLRKAWTTVDCAFNLYNRNDEKNKALAKQLERREADVDNRQQAITVYLSKLMQKSLSDKEAAQIPMLLHCTNDAERIGDHTSIICSVIERIKEGEIRFSQEAEVEFNELHDQLALFVEKTIELLKTQSAQVADDAEDLYHDLQAKLTSSENSHINRINTGLCQPRSGILYLELLEEIRKISRHVRNIAERAVLLGGEITIKSEVK